MDAPLQDQIRYLELRLAECTARPELHRHQIPAYQHQLELARQSPTALAYLEAMQRTGTTIEIARAEWLDRYINWSCIYDALGNEEKQRAALHNHAAALTAGTPHDFAAAITAAKLVTGPWQQAIDASLSTLPGLLIALLDWAAESDAGVKEELGDTVAAFWRVMRDSDPLCTWQRVCDYPPYRQRIPFDDAALQIIGAWLRQAVGAERCDQPREPVQDTSAAGPPASPTEATEAAEAAEAAEDGPAPLEVPTAQQAALAYHLAYDALDKSHPGLETTRAVYERIFAIEAAAGSGPAFLRMMAEEDIYGRLAREPQLAVAEAALAHCQGLSQPHMEHHYRALLDALRRSRSPTEVEYELERLGELFATETAWNRTFLRYAFKAVTAASAYQFDRSEARRQTIVTSDRLVGELFGRGWDAMLRTPRAWDFFCKVFFTRGQQIAPADAGSPGTHMGEVGLPAVEGVREATIWRAMERLQPADIAAGGDPMATLAQQPQFASPEDMRAYLTDLFRQAMADSPAAAASAASGRALILWGQPVSMDDLLGALGNPPRPQVTLTALAPAN